MIEKVLNTIQKYNLISENDKIVVGVSGGPDSMCLLHILNLLKNDLKIELVVAHINHMIREEAEEETKYVEQYCLDNNIECYIEKIDVIKLSKTEKIGTEEAGRKARYEFFETVLKKVNANKIATAHNANDNAETVLMNIFRGTGISGLKGIEPIRDNKFIRPIIECERYEIEEYCKINSLNPKIDKSNFENVYTRNKIRNIIIPEIKKECNTNIIEAINKLSYIAKEENNFVERYVNSLIENELIIKNNIDKTIVQNCKNYLVIDLKKFNQLDGFIKSNVILKLIQNVLGSTQGIEKKHIDDIIKLCSKNLGNKYLKPNKNIKVLVLKGRVYFTTE